MWFSNIALVAVLSSLCTISSAANTKSANFIADDFSVGFALNIPEQSSNDELYFTITGLSYSSWLAVGMGLPKMANSLIFMVYSSSDGSNITLSPRFSHGNTEPSYTSSITTEILAGSGVNNGTMTVNARCQMCRSWATGSLAQNSTNAPFIYAVGPDGSLRSSSKHASVKRHAIYGSFTMDLTQAVGPAGIPDRITADSKGSVEKKRKLDHELAAKAHACIMVFVFVGLLPVGVLVLRIFNRPIWHAFNQFISLGLAMVGMILGFVIGRMYNRTRKFNSAHQIFGLLIMIAMIGQFVIGVMHHRIYRRNKKVNAAKTTTVYTPYHIWLGRIVILSGIINGFLGFPLALNPRYNYVLTGLVGLVVILSLPLIWWKRERFFGSTKGPLVKKQNPDFGPEGYQERPWETGSTVRLHTYPPGGYETRYS
ncbi:hypothetical protein PVAG01_03532 [Phlyctema vagabunda]|uniref:DOMON domain-containing protein n=1 Tax=Phlyctema vagabunda TaxID=108571 RepID=A0ABR4PMV4_9HELO